MSGRKQWRRGMVAWTVAASLAGAPLGAARAEDRKPLTKEQKEESMSRYERGTTFYKVGKYAEAIEEYQKVYFITNDPVMLYNMAQSYRLWGKPEEALRLYKVFLNDMPAAKNRVEVEGKIADLQKQIAEKNAAPAPAPVVTPPPAPVAPPAITAPVPAPTPVVVAEKKPAAEKSNRRVYGWSLVGVAGAFVTTSVVLGLMSGAKAREVEDDAKNGREFNPDTEKSGKSLSKAAGALGVLGVVAGAGGLYLLLTGRGANETAQGTSSARHALRPTIHPMLGPGLAGAGAHFTF